MVHGSFPTANVTPSCMFDGKEKVLFKYIVDTCIEQSTGYSPVTTPFPLSVLRVWSRGVNQEHLADVRTIDLSPIFGIAVR